jgi:hypothetical protein
MHIFVSVSFTQLLVFPTFGIIQRDSHRQPEHTTSWNTVEERHKSHNSENRELLELTYHDRITSSNSYDREYTVHRITFLRACVE